MAGDFAILAFGAIWNDYLTAMILLPDRQNRNGVRPSVGLMSMRFGGAVYEADRPCTRSIDVV